MNKEEEIRKKIEAYDLLTLQDKFINLFIEYMNLKDSNNKTVEITDELISSMFKKLKSLDYDKSKKANLRKIILELESTQSELLYKYLSQYI